MDFYNILKNMDKDSRDTYIAYKIKSLKEEQVDNKIIGYKVPEMSFFEGDTLDVSCINEGFIKEDSRIVYSVNVEPNGYVSDRGNHYYIDDDSYIYDFFDFIMDKDINNLYQLLFYIENFLNSYFSGLGIQSREKMFAAIENKYGRDFIPTKKHTISNFKGKGNGLCSEYSSMAQNLLSVLNIDSVLIFGAFNLGDIGGAHAYNIICDEDEKNYLVDFSYKAHVLDINHNTIGYLPFIAELDNFDDDMIKDLIDNNRVMSFEDYSWYLINKNMLKLYHNVERDYYIDANREKKKAI